MVTNSTKCIPSVCQYYFERGEYRLCARYDTQTMNSLLAEITPWAVLTLWFQYVWKLFSHQDLAGSIWVNILKEHHTTALAELSFFQFLFLFLNSDFTFQITDACKFLSKRYCNSRGFIVQGRPVRALGDAYMHHGQSRGGKNTRKVCKKQVN